MDDRGARLGRARQLGRMANGHPKVVEVVVPELLAMLDTETDDVVVAELLAGLGHAHDERATEVICRFGAHPTPMVRFAVAQALNILPDPPGAATATLIELSRDTVDDVRDWACLALGNLLADNDIDAVRDALAERLDDPHADTRCEALVGLAQRRDPRTLPFVAAALEGDNPFALEIQAAGALGDPLLHALLERHLEGWEEPSDRLRAQAAWRLTDPAGLGDDLIAGIASAVQGLVAEAPSDLGENEWWTLFLSINAIDDTTTDGTARAVDEALSADPAARARLRATWLGQDLPPIGPPTRTAARAT